ncbi:MAG: hypothetical protein N0C88_11555 [Candidatus Thiodiazotropha lotti]|uniref:Uncharacterized protein n=1 Tax=Candidatus Thiodiazotropha lotti TaxID=2792787 RepID=A0A9E4N1B3_9GAMM|nr:hypothetical protein [Candidatus Thiodiazotropha lotti]MCW4203942.1 hypothetical protein [Candidatus Thiodiazotropha lotti]
MIEQKFKYLVFLLVLVAFFAGVIVTSIAYSSIQPKAIIEDIRAIFFVKADNAEKNSNYLMGFCYYDILESHDIELELQKISEKYSEEVKFTEIFALNIMDYFSRANEKNIMNDSLNIDKASSMKENFLRNENCQDNQIK